MWLKDTTTMVSDAKRSRFLTKKELLPKYPNENKWRRNFMFLHDVPLEVEEAEGLLLLKKFPDRVIRSDSPNKLRQQNIEKDEREQKERREKILAAEAIPTDDVETMKRPELIQTAKSLGINHNLYINATNEIIKGLIRVRKINAAA